MKIKLIFATLIVVEIFLLGVIFLQDVNFQLLSPKGPIARQQRDLIFLAFSLMLVVAIPLLTTIYYFAFRYRNDKKSIYDPHATHDKFFEFLWWVIPGIFILILAAITWQKTHALDPYKPLESKVEPVRIQVVALDWKWLFIYPEYNIATVNFIQIPVDTPINFELTAEAPMNSFWIPQLSGQIYAMTGMSTKLHLSADSVGDYRGQAAEINGRGFSGMNFTARATSHENFKKWVYDIKTLPNKLSINEYEKLLKPSENNPPAFYSSTEEGLYNKIITKYMVDSAKNTH